MAHIRVATPQPLAKAKMNVEEFKYTIVKQFKYVNTAIRCLMLMEKPSSTHTNFLATEEFTADEFNLRVHIASVFDERGNVRFEVRFKEVERGNFLSAEYLQDISEVPMHLKKEHIREEFIILSFNKLVFGVWTYLLVCEDYEFRKRSISSRYLEFDLTTMKFVEDDSMIENTLGTWCDIREDDNYYIDYAYDELAENELMGYLKSCGLSRDKIFDITNAFSKVETFTHLSPLTQMIKALVNLSTTYA